MNLRVLLRWMVSIVIAVGLLGVIGLALNPPVQARVALVYDWPGVGPCSASLQQCIDAAVVQPGDTIRIKPGIYTQSVTLAKPVSLIGDGRVTTILNAEPGQRVLTVTGSISFTTVISGLTFKDGNAAGSVCPGACGGGVLIAGAARPTLQNIALVNNTAAWQGGGLWVEGGPDLKLVNAAFISNTAVGGDGGGLWTPANTQVFDSIFERNTAGEDGGGAYVDGSTSLYAANSTFFKNKAILGVGGGAYVGGAAILNGGWVKENLATSGGGLQVSSLIFTGTEVTNNTAYNDGGGAAVFGPVQLQGGKFVGNASTTGNGGALTASSLRAWYTSFLSNTASNGLIQQGGAAYVWGGPNDLDQVWFQNNQVKSNGGGLYATSLTTLTAVTMISNTARAGQGGGAFIGSPVKVVGGSYADNFADISGGGLYASSLSLQGTHVDNNRTNGDGGGLHSADGPLTLTDSQLNDNVAGQSGGGLYAFGSVWVTSSLFIHNSASNGGGLYHAMAGDAYLVNALFARNQSAPTQTAAIAFAATGSFSMVHSTIVDNVLNPASAISIDNGNAASDLRDNIVSGHAIGLNLISGGSYEDYNLYFNTGITVSGPVASGGHSLPSAAPQFVNPLADDYHLRFTSPAIDAGINVGVNFDVDGQPRPIGLRVDIGFDEAASSIQQLIDVTPPGGTVNIPAGVYTESLTLYKPVSLIGAGIGSTIINAAPSDRVLTVTGSTILPTTQIVSLTLQGGRLGGSCQGFCNGGGVLIVEGAYPSFQSVMINDNQAVMGGGLYIQSGGAQLVASSVVGNQATQSGGGAYVEAANATLEQFGGTFGGNLAIDGAGVFVQAGLFKQTGGVIYNNVASHWGGGMLIGSGGAIRTALGQIISNSAVNSGGGLFVDVGIAELRDSLIKNNSAYDGGGIYVRDWPGTGAAIIGGKLESNFADTINGYGGGVYAGGTVHITGTRFFSNTAFDGSALEITGTAQARLVNAFIAGNRAGGAFPSTNSSVRFDSTGDSIVLQTTFGNATEVLTRALTVNSGVVTVANTIVASYTNGLSQFGGRLAEDYNLFFRTPVTYTGSISNGGHSLSGPNPLFQNPLNGDYHIKGISPAVNRGANVGVRRDIDQDARPLGGGFDIGADEASVAGTIPGPNIGGSFTYTTMQNSTINLNVPPGAVTQTTPIYCSLIATDTMQPPRRLKFAGVLFELDAQLDPLNDSTPGSINFNVPVTLTVSYTDAELASAGISDESTMVLYRFEPSLNEWQPIGYRPGETQTLDVDNNLITATVLGFSRFGQMGFTSGFEVFLPLAMRN